MSSRHEILDQVTAIARDTLDWHGTIVEETRLLEDLGLDSVRALTLLIEIENRLKIRLTPDDEAEILTVGDLLTAIERRLEAKD